MKTEHLIIVSQGLIGGLTGVTTAVVACSLCPIRPPNVEMGIVGILLIALLASGVLGSLLWDGPRMHPSLRRFGGLKGFLRFAVLIGVVLCLLLAEVGGAFAISIWVNPLSDDDGASSPDTLINALPMTILAFAFTSLACPIGARLTFSRLKR